MPVNPHRAALQGLIERLRKEEQDRRADPWREYPANAPKWQMTNGDMCAKPSTYRHARLLTEEALRVADTETSKANLRLIEITPEDHDRAAEGGRYTLPPGWWLLGDEGPEGPFGSQAEASIGLAHTLVAELWHLDRDMPGPNEVHEHQYDNWTSVFNAKALELSRLLGVLLGESDSMTKGQACDRSTSGDHGADRGS